MTQEPRENPYPHDPFGGEPAAPVNGEQPATGGGQDAPGAPSAAPVEQPAASPYGQEPAPSGSPYGVAPSSTGDPGPGAYGSRPSATDAAAPSHDPYAAPQDAPAPGGYGQGGFGQGGSPQGAYDRPDQQQGGYTQGGYPHENPAQGGTPYGSGPQGAAAGGHPAEVPPPPGFKGLHEGPLGGQPVSPSDAKLWSTIAQGSTVIGYLIGVGFLGWVGPLVVYLMYKDRDRFVRYNAAEALNAAIAVVIVNVVLAILFTIITVVTLGFGAIVWGLFGIPALIHVVFAIIGGIRSYKGEWWNYPVNIRLFR